MGLRFPVPEWLSSPSGAEAGLTGFGVWYVVGVVWFARAFVLIPYWRSGGKREIGASAGVVAAGAPVE